jgi:hypothetical protein
MRNAEYRFYGGDSAGFLKRENNSRFTGGEVIEKLRLLS